MSFERFMELALYAPGVGYYERPEGRIGRRGDFYTSVSVGEVFGFLLAAEAVDRFSTWERVDWIEAGAHDGQWMADVLAAWDRFWPGFGERVSPCLVEPSPTRRELQRQRLADRGDRVRWVSDLGVLEGNVRGALVSNELLDAFPVRRWEWGGPEVGWNELGVALEGERLVECRWRSADPLDPGVTQSLVDVLPVGFVVERSRGAVDWWSRAAASLRKGALITLDYGHDSETGLRPESLRGTVRAYRKHRMSDDLLADPGEQDLTAHVDFPRIARLGEQAGCTTEALLPQGRWLGSIGARVFGRGGAPAEWLAQRSRQFQTLTHPSHLGAAMKALVQVRRAEAGDGPRG